MSNRTKFVLTYVAGIVTGIILVLVVILCIGTIYLDSEDSANNDVELYNRPNDDGVKLFDSPKNEIKAKEFRVIQVLSDGSALAMYDNVFHDENAPEYGTVVLFQATEESSYYDDQNIKRPKGKHFRQIGIYRYETHQGMEKTVPVVGIFNN